MIAEVETQFQFYISWYARVWKWMKVWETETGKKHLSYELHPSPWNLRCTEPKEENCQFAVGGMGTHKSSGPYSTSARPIRLFHTGFLFQRLSSAYLPTSKQCTFSLYLLLVLPLLPVLLLPRNLSLPYKLVRDVNFCNGNLSPCRFRSGIKHRVPEEECTKRSHDG